MDIIDREDFIEFDELEKTIDIDNIPYENSCVFSLVSFVMS